MDSLWNYLPPELHEHILKFTVRIKVYKPSYQKLHKEIKANYYYDPDIHVNTWAAPSISFIRLYETGKFVKKIIDKYGCERYYRSIYRNNLSGNARVIALQFDKKTYCPISSGDDKRGYIVDITNAYTHSKYEDLEIYVS